MAPRRPPAPPRPPGYVELPPELFIEVDDDEQTLILENGERAIHRKDQLVSVLNDGDHQEYDDNGDPTGNPSIRFARYIPAGIVTVKATVEVIE
jgi:hypothetical protein